MEYMLAVYEWLEIWGRIRDGRWKIMGQLADTMKDFLKNYYFYYSIAVFAGRVGGKVASTSVMRVYLLFCASESENETPLIFMRRCFLNVQR